MFLPFLLGALFATAVINSIKSSTQKLLPSSSNAPPQPLPPSPTPRTSRPSPQPPRQQGETRTQQPRPGVAAQSSQTQSSQAQKQEKLKAAVAQVPPEVLEALSKAKAGTATTPEATLGLLWQAKTQGPAFNPQTSPFYKSLQKSEGEVSAAKMLSRLKMKMAQG